MPPRSRARRAPPRSHSRSKSTPPGCNSRRKKRQASSPNTVELSLYGINAQGKPLQGLRTALELTLRPETHQRVKQYGLRANPRVELPPGRYQVRIGVRESGAGEMGTVFYDLDVPDFARGRLSMSGLLLTAPSAQRTLTVQADQAAAKLLPGAATRPPRLYVVGRAVAVCGDLRKQFQWPTAPGRCDDALDRRSGARCVRRSRRSRARPFPANDKSATFAVSREVPLKDVAPGRYLLRVEARASWRDREMTAPSSRETSIRVHHGAVIFKRFWIETPSNFIA